MANKKSSEGKGAALAKRSKIDSMQRNMFIAVCLASIILGISVVGVIRLAKSIAFYNNVIVERDKVIKGSTKIQNDLKLLKDNVANLVSNENLESVARSRDEECLSKSAQEIDNESYKNASIEVARTCSALRMIPDALPSSKNVEATMASMNQLLYWSNKRQGVNFESLSSSDGGSAGSQITSSVHVSTVRLSLKDDAEKIHGALAEIENSVRNFDISSANISWKGASISSGKLEFNATYSAYYSDTVYPVVYTRTVCAKADSKKCLASGGNSVGDEYGEPTTGAGTVSN